MRFGKIGGPAHIVLLPECGACTEVQKTQALIKQGEFEYSTPNSEDIFVRQHSEVKAQQNNHGKAVQK